MSVHPEFISTFLPLNFQVAGSSLETFSWTTHRWTQRSLPHKDESVQLGKKKRTKKKSDM